MSRSSAALLLLLFASLSLLAADRAAAEPVTLRFATIAPEGTGWAREFKAFARDAEAFSDGNCASSGTSAASPATRRSCPSASAAGNSTPKRRPPAAPASPPRYA